jgi:hypothetical protein
MYRCNETKIHSSVQKVRYRYATQYGGVLSMCVRQPPLFKLIADAIFILILINNLKQVKLYSINDFKKQTY